MDGSATAGTQGCAASPGGGPGKEFRGASQSCGGQLKPPCDLQDPGGPARPGASRGRGCHRCVTAQPHTHTDTHHTDVRTHGHAQSREGAPTGPGGRGRDAVPADRRGVRRGHGGLSPVRCTGPQQLRLFYDVHVLQAARSVNNAVSAGVVFREHGVSRVWSRRLG